MENTRRKLGWTVGVALALFAILALGSAGAQFFSGLSPFAPTNALAEDAPDYTLTILHTNDVHAHFLPFNKMGATCGEKGTEDENCVGGAARLAGVIKKVREERSEAILLDAGDQFQGTLFYTRWKGEGSSRLMTKMGYDAMVVGNHEFDNGPCNLGAFIKSVRFPVLGANLNVQMEPCLDGLIKPYTVLTAGGQKIGVVGFTTEDLATSSSPGGNVTAQQIEASIRPVIQGFKALGINKIIGLSHAGLERDKTVAEAVDGLDVIVGGHSHTYLSSTDPSAQGPYPVVEHSPDGGTVLIVTSGAWGKYLGRLDVTFDANGAAKSWTGGPIPIDASSPEDPNVASIVADLDKPLAELREQVVGSSKTNLTGAEVQCRFEECPIGNLITDAMLWATANRGVRIAFENGGGVRAGIPAGEVRMGQILEALPFGNTLATMEIKGEDILAALENGVSRADKPTGGGTGRFLQTAGLHYVWNPDAPVGSRVVKAEVVKPDGGLEPLQADAVYKVAVNSFLRRGGDGYTVFVEKAKKTEEDGPTLDEAVAAYIRTHSPIAPATEGRITRSAAKKQEDSGNPVKSEKQE